MCHMLMTERSKMDKKREQLTVLTLNWCRRGFAMHEMPAHSKVSDKI